MSLKYKDVMSSEYHSTKEIYGATHHSILTNMMVAHRLGVSIENVFNMAVNIDFISESIWSLLPMALDKSENCIDHEEKEAKIKNQIFNEIDNILKTLKKIKEV